MPQNNPINSSILQQIYLIQELDQAILLIESGLAVLQKSKPFDQKHFVFLLLLSSGIERLLKIVICLDAIQTEGKPPSKSELKKLSHDVYQLVTLVGTKCFTSDYLQRPIAVQDLEFITTN